MNLLIVESSSKTKKLQSILGREWHVVATGGHFLHLNSKKDGKYGSIGINLDSLDLDMVMDERGRKSFSRIKKMIGDNNYQTIVLATDPDREGEVIAHHLQQRLQLKDYQRATFNSITDKEVKTAVSNPRLIDDNLVSAGEARRILDRYVGWTATEKASDYLAKNSPVGRVQSAVLKLVVDRENSIKNFKARDYFVVHLDFDGFSAKLDVEQSKLPLNDGYFDDKALATAISNHVKGKDFKVVASETKPYHRQPPHAFETSSLKQAGMNRLGFGNKQIDTLAQSLFASGHITYLRTDSTEMSDDGFLSLQEYAKANGITINNTKRKGKATGNAQEAHECIRPTDFNFDGQGLSDDELALYNLIKQRAIASQMPPAVYDKTTLTLACPYNEYTLIGVATGLKLLDKGFLKFLACDDTLDETVDDEPPVPMLAVDSVVACIDGRCQASKTKAPAYYTQASLVGEMKSKGIGRPSTYTSSIERLFTHGYLVENKKGNKKVLGASEHGIELIDKVAPKLKVIDVAFTSEMENDLDKIANGKLEWQGYVKAFFKIMQEDYKGIAQVKIDCMNCSKDHLKRFKYKSKAGYFWVCPSCETFYNDDNGKPIPQAPKVHLNDDGGFKFHCTKCQSGLYFGKSKKTGKVFWVCTNDKCNTFYDDDNGKPVEQQKAKEVTADCLNCDGQVVKRKRKSDGSEFFVCKACNSFFDCVNDKPKKQSPKSK